VTYLLDTNALSEVKKRVRNPGFEKWYFSTPTHQLHVSVLTIGEIGHGLTKLLERGDSSQAAVFQPWLEETIRRYGDRIVPVTMEIARVWGEQSRRQQVGQIDALIAATAQVHDWIVVTRNVKDFELTGVRVLNPFTE
jgi:predicted nucleic acid-binding protein